MSPDRLLVVADVLAKSVVLAHDEREVAKVFEIIEPFAKELADHGRTGRNRKGMLECSEMLCWYSTVYRAALR